MVQDGVASPRAPLLCSMYSWRPRAPPRIRRGTARSVSLATVRPGGALGCRGRQRRRRERGRLHRSAERAELQESAPPPTSPTFDREHFGGAGATLGSLNVLIEKMKRVFIGAGDKVIARSGSLFSFAPLSLYGSVCRWPPPRYRCFCPLMGAVLFSS